MKSLLQYSAAMLLVIAIITGCQKNYSEKQLSDGSENLNLSLAKKWYVESFEHTTEAKNAWVQGKKFPDWKNGIYRKSANLEILELPLLKQKTKLLVRSDNTLSPTQSKQVVSGSLTRVLFIRENNNKIIIRQVDYIPNWHYLEQKRFDISSVSYGKKGNDFSGTMVIKDWSGKILAMRLLQDGKIVKKVSSNRTDIPLNDEAAVTGLSVNQSTNEQCVPVTYCMFYIDCQVIGERLTDNCTDPYMDPNDCYTEMECTYDNEDPCGLYGCPGDNPGGVPQEPVIDYSCYNGQKNDFLLEAGSTVAGNTDVSSSSTYVDPLTRNIQRSWACFAGYGGWKLISHETGVVKYEQIRLLNYNRWRWESLTHHSITMEGSTKPGVSVDFSQGVGTSYVSALYANMNLSFSVTYSFICNCPSLPLNWIVTPVSKNYTNKSSLWPAKPE